MEIFLLRHGLAIERGTPGWEDDSARPLVPKGKKQLKRVCRAMAELDIEFDLLLSSPYLRGKETAQIIAAGLKFKKPIKFSDALTPESDPEHIIPMLQKLKPAPKSILLVGHEPFLSTLISLLVTGERGLQMELAKASLCRLESKKIHSGSCATLTWLITPKQMKLMA